MLFYKSDEACVCVCISVTSMIWYLSFVTSHSFHCNTTFCEVD